MKNTQEAVSEVIDNLRRIYQSVSDYSKSAERLTELTGPQLWALKILNSSEPMKVSDLARAMYLSPATVVGIIDRLEVKGLVKRVRSTEDRRVVELHLSDNGMKLVSKAPEVAQAQLLKGLSELSEEQFLHVARGMQLMVQILGAENDHPQPLH